MIIRNYINNKSSRYPPDNFLFLVPPMRMLSSGISERSLSNRSLWTLTSLVVMRVVNTLPSNYCILPNVQRQQLTPFPVFLVNIATNLQCTQLTLRIDNVQCTFYSGRCTVQHVHCTMCIYIVQYTLYILYILYGVYWTTYMYTVR